MMRNVIRPLLLLAAYAVALSVLVPNGINRHFLLVLLGVAVVLLMVGIILTIRVGRASRGSQLPIPAIIEPVESIKVADIWLILLPLTPVMQFVLVNSNEVPWSDSVGVVLAFAALSATLVVIVPFLTRRYMSPVVTRMLGLSLAFALLSMAALAKGLSWHQTGDPLVQIGLFAAVFGTGVLLYRRQSSGAAFVAVAYFVVSVVLTVNQIWIVASEVSPTTGRAGDSTVDRLGAWQNLEWGQGLPADPADIVMLTYDSYVENETMIQYGIDNSAQEAFLEAQGFEVFRGTYSTAPHTLASMGRVLGGPPLGQAVAGDSPLLDGLRSAGYETHGIFWSDYFFRRSPASYDSFYPPVLSGNLLMQSILGGEFRYTSSFVVPPWSEFIHAKRSLLEARHDGPVFVYTHTGPHHSQNSGACRDDEVEQFHRRLEEANAEMRADVQTVVASRPHAIVIVNGDHGPYLTKNCTSLGGAYDAKEVTRHDIQDRFGAFLAIRLPDGMAGRDLDIEVLQDVLPAVLGAMNSETSERWQRPASRLVNEELGAIAGVTVDGGLIVGGRHDGEPLFTSAVDAPATTSSSPRDPSKVGRGPDTGRPR